MKRMDEALSKLARSPDFKERYESMRREILEDPAVKAFLDEQEDRIPPDVLDKNLMKLYEFKTQSFGCEKCPSLEGCINMMKGYEPKLVWRRGGIDIDYHRCPRKVRDDEQRKNEKLIKSLYVPKDILHADFSSLDLGDNGRLKAIELAEEFIENYTKDKSSKGLYIYGPFGVGKSYLLGAIANDLADMNVSSLIVYFPEFIRELKQSFNDQSMDKKLEVVKTAPILMIDDIGAETMSSWMRDDILGTILQFRMLEGLPTLFTSNFNYDGLEHHLTYSQRGEKEEMKAKRIMERIQYLTNPVEMKGANRRK
ncbi:primosomal protein DnaI [Bacillus thermotolerans]|uniref:Helicase loader DnaI n=1 Tax=Bacillus thermotolerans TaxID=1221996 RepID=A0A0F5HX73_BACTR|nr:primosomal protein DnaI [Bacillus thermotolerans]KKB37625.1 Helicase loader DnaI [Bacillus thermotolerans]KKB43324.1 Helicase loader DnaI [Bacillus thermotolerans]